MYQYELSQFRIHLKEEKKFLRRYNKELESSNKNADGVKNEVENLAEIRNKLIYEDKVREHRLKEIEERNKFRVTSNDTSTMVGGQTEKGDFDDVDEDDEDEEIDNTSKAAPGSSKDEEGKQGEDQIEPTEEELERAKQEEEEAQRIEQEKIAEAKKQEMMVDVQQVEKMTTDLKIEFSAENHFSRIKGIDSIFAYDDKILTSKIYENYSITE
jgi:hypothetical protein